jgi:peroxiredoxin Q/BCP
MGNRVGDKAADFALPDQDGNEVRLYDELDARPVVLVFFRMAGAPACTNQMWNLREAWPELMGRVKVFGISYDSLDALKRFKNNEHLPFPLLSDRDRQVAKMYGVNGMLSAARTSFVISADGRIESVIDHPTTTNHANEILDEL